MLLRETVLPFDLVAHRQRTVDVSIVALNLHLVVIAEADMAFVNGRPCGSRVFRVPYRTIHPVTMQRTDEEDRPSFPRERGLQAGLPEQDKEKPQP